MALGKGYKPRPEGMREIGKKPELGRMAKKAADNIASELNATGKGKYEAQSKTVLAGWNNEARAGARVVAVGRQNVSDAKAHLMADITKKMGARDSGR